MQNLAPYRAGLNASFVVTMYPVTKGLPVHAIQHRSRHDSAYIFVAICPQRGVGAFITLGANTEMMNLHLAEISTRVALGAHAVLICDGAGWHRKGELLNVPENMTLPPLPPYSPEQNPMENVWDGSLQNRMELVHRRSRPHHLNR